MYKIVRPAVGESLRYQHLKFPVIHLALQLHSVCLPFFFIFVLREMPLAELKNKYRKMVSGEKARSCWEDEYEVSSKQVWILKVILRGCATSLYKDVGVFFFVQLQLLLFFYANI